jgi:hypothetical protein
VLPASTSCHEDGFGTFFHVSLPLLWVEIMHPKAHGPVLAWCFGGCVVFAVVVGPSGLGCVGRLPVVVAGLLSAAVVVTMAAVVALLR